MFIYRGTILASLTSCGITPSLHHWRRTSYKRCSRLVLQCLIRSGGVLCSGSVVEYVGGGVVDVSLGGVIRM